MPLLILILIALLISLPLQAQTRYALVIGNGLYEPSLPLSKEPNLPNPRSDAQAVAQQLRQFGFQVTDIYDQNRAQMDNNISRFLAQLSLGDVGLFYYAGHALEINNINWLIPVQTEITHLTLPDRTLSAQTILANMEAAILGDGNHANGLNLMLLDACRNNPFRSIRLRSGQSGGLGGMEPGTVGSLVSFAAVAGKPALDALGDGQHSPYTSALLKYMQQQSGLSIDNLFKKISLEVQNQSGQQPWLRSSISGGDFCLHPKGCASVHWQRLMHNKPTQAQLLAFLDDYPNSEQAQTAKVLLDALGQGSTPPPPVIAAPPEPIKPDYSAQLRTCATHLAANRLTQGDSGNALDCYKNVLRQDAGNAQALQGLATIENAFVTLIENKIAAGDFSGAQSRIERLQSLNAEHRDLTRLQQALIAQREQRDAISPRDGISKNYRETAAGLALEMLWIKGGCFQMGSPESEDGHQSDEAQKRVCVHDNDGYWMSQTEVTIGHYLSCVQAKACRPPEWLEAGNEYNIHTGSDDWYKKVGMSESNPQHPITGVSWTDAVKFAAWLQQQSGKSYRLPTAAEWEYAARAGGSSPYGQAQGGTAISTDNLSRYAWFSDNANKQTHPVGAKPANPWGLQDMIGNVWEWTCSDYANSYDGNEQQCAEDSNENKELRGCAWYNNAGDCRLASRYFDTSSGRYFSNGFRLVAVSS